MATIPKYIKIMRDTSWDISQRLGIDLAFEDKALRAAIISTLAVQAILINKLVEKGVITDQELIDAINTVRNSPWSPEHEPVRPEPWETTPVTGLSVSGV